MLFNMTIARAIAERIIPLLKHLGAYMFVFIT